jgi:hypothetical protein
VDSSFWFALSFWPLLRRKYGSSVMGLSKDARVCSLVGIYCAEFTKRVLGHRLAIRRLVMKPLLSLLASLLFFLSLPSNVAAQKLGLAISGARPLAQAEYRDGIESALGLRGTYLAPWTSGLDLVGKLDSDYLFSNDEYYLGDSRDPRDHRIFRSSALMGARAHARLGALSFFAQLALGVQLRRTSYALWIDLESSLEHTVEYSVAPVAEPALGTAIALGEAELVLSLAAPVAFYRHSVIRAFGDRATTTIDLAAAVGLVWKL